MTLGREDFLGSFDLQEAYPHLPIRAVHHRFLHFSYHSLHIQCCALPFGLSSAPRVFTKALDVLVAHLQLQGLAVYPYLDDLMKARSFQQEELHVTSNINCLSYHGFVVSRGKSHLVPYKSFCTWW